MSTVGLAAAVVMLAVAGAPMIDLQGRVGDQPRERPAILQAARPAPSAEPAAVRPAKPGASRAQVAAIGREAAARTFVWPSVASAEYYNVQFLRRRRKVFEAWPRSARLVVVAGGVAGRRGFRFSPGRYRWIVRPGFGARSRGRYGAPIVVSTWTFTRPAEP